MGILPLGGPPLEHRQREVPAKSQVDRRTGPARQPRTHRQRRHLGLPFAGGRQQLDERLPDGRHAAAGGLPVASGITRPDVGNLRPVYPRSRHLAVRRTAQRHGRRLSDQDPQPAADRTGSLADGLHQLLRQRRTHHQQGVGTHRRKPQHRPSEIPVVDDPHPVAQQADGGRHRLGRLRDSLLVAVVVGNHLHDVRLQEGLHAQRPLGIPLRRRMAQPGRGRAQQDHQGLRLGQRQHLQARIRPLSGHQPRRSAEQRRPGLPRIGRPGPLRRYPEHVQHP